MSTSMFLYWGGRRWWRRTSQQVCEYEDVTITVRRGRELMSNRPDIILICNNKKERENSHTDTRGNTSEEQYHVQAEKKLEYKSLCKGIQRVWNLKCMIIPVIIGATGIITESFKEQICSHTRKTFNRFATKHSHIWNITHNTESTAVWIFKPERWGSQLVPEKYQEEKDCYRGT